MPRMAFALSLAVGFGSWFRISPRKLNLPEAAVWTPVFVILISTSFSFNVVSRVRFELRGLGRRIAQVIAEHMQVYKSQRRK